jgi:outer membrane protein OmpA-like peptidoglycan-associated protein
MSNRLLLSSMVSSLMLALAAANAGAQPVRLYGANETVDPDDVARILNTQQPVKPPAKIKMRSLRLLDDSATATTTQIAYAEQAVAQPSSPAQEKTSAMALPVRFAFDSFEILPETRPQLDALAEGIRRLPATQRVVIEGHTDAAGSDFYNELLSQKRASTVKRYLVSMHGIDAERLRVLGMGEFVPLPGMDPNAAENRRVQFRGE